MKATFAILITASFFLTGCSSTTYYWKHPNNSSAQTQSDNAGCQLVAQQAYNSAGENPNYYGNRVNEKTKYKGSYNSTLNTVSVTETKTSKKNPFASISDNNYKSSQSQKAYELCMRSKGYFKVRETSNNTSTFNYYGAYGTSRKKYCKNEARVQGGVDYLKYSKCLKGGENKDNSNEESKQTKLKNLSDKDLISKEKYKKKGSRLMGDKCENDSDCQGNLVCDQIRNTCSLLEYSHRKSSSIETFSDKSSKKTVDSHKSDGSAETKLTKLKNLYDKGLISKEQYEKKQQEVLDEM